VADQMTEFLAGLPRRGGDPLLADLTATFRFDLVNGDPTSWLVNFRDGEIRVSPGGGVADCAVAAERQLFDGLAGGTVNAMAAFLRGELAVSGDPGLLVRMLRLFPGGDGK
jgi:putative sterol carrier protein